jgi:hypothetical protein
MSVPWCSRGKSFLAGLVRAIDVDEERIKVDRTKDEIKQAPELDTQLLHDSAYQESVTRHYGGSRSGV